MIFSIIYLLLSVWVKAAFSLDFPPTMRLPVKQRPSVVIEETFVSFVIFKLSSCGLTLTLLCEPWRHWDFKILVKVRLKSELQVKNNSRSCCQGEETMKLTSGVVVLHTTQNNFLKYNQNQSTSLYDFFLKNLIIYKRVYNHIKKIWMYMCI